MTAKRHFIFAGLKGQDREFFQQIIAEMEGLVTPPHKAFEALKSFVKEAKIDPAIASDGNLLLALTLATNLVTNICSDLRLYMNGTPLLPRAPLPATNKRFHYMNDAYHILLSSIKICVAVNSLGEAPTPQNKKKIIEKVQAISEKMEEGKFFYPIQEMPKFIGLAYVYLSGTLFFTRKILTAKNTNPDDIETKLTKLKTDFLEGFMTPAPADVEKMVKDRLAPDGKRYN